MLYIIVEEMENKTYLVNEEVYQTKEKAEEERIYFQPDYNGKLKVKEII